MADRAHWGRDLLLLTLFLGLLFGFKLGERPLWSPDEGRYSEIPREMVASGDYLTPRLNGVKYFEKPPLFYWLQSLSIQLFGLSEWSLRLWTAIFALFGCLAVYTGGRKLFGQKSGLLASVILATSLLYFAMGRIITLDMSVSILLTCALLAFIVGTSEPVGTRRRLILWAFYIFAALATLTKGLIGIVIPGMVIGLWIALMGEWSLLKKMYLPSGIAIFLLVTLPWHILVAQANPEFLNFYIVHEHFQRFLTKRRGPLRQWWIFIPVLLLGMFPWTVFLIQAIRHNLPLSWRRRRQHKEALFLILWAGLVLVFFSASSSKLIPYILPIFPPLAILIGRYLAAAWDGRHLPGIPSGYWIFFIMSSMLVAAALMPGQRYLKGYSDVARFTLSVYTLTSLLTFGSLATLILGRYGGFRGGFSALTLTSVLFLVVLNSSLMLFNQRRSVKELAVALQHRLRPGNEVVSYQTYYQDLPVYLQRRITVVGWKGELNFGARVEDVSGWMIEDAEFWQKWNGPFTVYMVTSRARYSKLLAQSGRQFYLVAQTDYDVLLSNKGNPTELRLRREERPAISPGFANPPAKEAM